MLDRYHRQQLLPMIGAAGQSRLARARVVVLGCGALGTVAVELLARAGVGWIRLIDRDVVELTNLQRQTLYDERDAAEGRAKVVAAAQHLRAINSTIAIEPIVSDVTPRNVERLCLDPRPCVVLDGTDNAETRYLLNDACVKHGVPWVYGAAVGTDGRAMTVRPGIGPCLRCLFPEPPPEGTLPTCDTVGVLGPLTMTVASIQVTMALRVMLGAGPGDDLLLSVDGWTLRSRSISLQGARRHDCACCVSGRFEHLERVADAATRMCGRSSVQLSLGAATGWADALVPRLRTVGVVRVGEQVMHFEPAAEGGITMTLFADGRVLVHGTRDPQKARTIAAKYLGV